MSIILSLLIDVYCTITACKKKNLIKETFLCMTLYFFSHDEFFTQSKRFHIRVNFYNINACYENTTCLINLVCISKIHKNKVVKFHCLFNACSTRKMLILAQFINFVKRFYVLQKNALSEFAKCTEIYRTLNLFLSILDLIIL